MNPTTHGVALGGGTVLGSALVTILASMFHMPPDLANAWITVATAAAGAVAGGVAWYIKWKWPNTPLPDVKP